MQTMHTHIEQKAYPYGQCPSCDVVWDAIRAYVGDHLLDLDQEFRVADQLRIDYGMPEALFHLTTVQERGQHLKYRVMQHMIAAKEI